MKKLVGKKIKKKNLSIGLNSQNVAADVELIENALLIANDLAEDERRRNQESGINTAITPEPREGGTDRCIRIRPGRHQQFSVWQGRGLLKIGTVGV